MIKIVVSKTEYAEFFEEVDVSSTFLLSKTDANKLWDEKIDESSLSYFTLGNNSWLIKGENTIQGNWIESYNDESLPYLSNTLDSTMEWMDNDIIWFLMSRQRAIETIWIEFKQYWRNFLSCDDDCPIILNSSDDQTAIIFSSIGNVLRIRKTF